MKKIMDGVLTNCAIASTAGVLEELEDYYMMLAGY